MEKINNKHNNNILSPRGSIGRLYYTIYMLLFIMMVTIFPDSKDNFALLLLSLLFYLLIFILIIFNVKKRIYDITANLALSWIFTVLFILTLTFTFSNFALVVTYIANLFFVFKKGKTDNFIVL